jgi:D-tyrosyl-tRNA(Tyr) deacylase
LKCLDLNKISYEESSHFQISDFKFQVAFDMRAVVQRVKESRVTAGGEIVGKIGSGLVVLLGVAKGDTMTTAEDLANKIVNLRIFEDENSRLNRSLIETGGQMLVVSQFTLLGDCRKGRRPSFVKAAGPSEARELYDAFITTVRETGVSVATGRFQAVMDVMLVNSGPVTLILEME